MNTDLFLTFTFDICHVTLCAPNALPLTAAYLHDVQLPFCLCHSHCRHLGDLLLFLRTSNTIAYCTTPCPVFYKSLRISLRYGGEFHSYLCILKFTEHSSTYSCSLRQPGQFTHSPIVHRTLYCLMFSLIFNIVFLIFDNLMGIEGHQVLTMLRFWYVLLQEGWIHFYLYEGNYIY
jgi:hypothetical protein